MKEGNLWNLLKNQKILDRFSCHIFKEMLNKFRSSRAVFTAPILTIRKFGSLLFCLCLQVPFANAAGQPPASSIYLY